MPQLVVMGAMLKCSFGLAPSAFTPTPGTVNGSKVGAGTIMDFKPMVNIKPFGMCTTQSNPTVAAATAAAMGTPTPAPCIPNTVAPWLRGSSTVMIGKMQALNSGSQCMCLWGGQITVTTPGQFTVNVGS
jgi:hypothetical protein